MTKDSEQMDKMPTNIYISDIDGSKCRCWGMEVYGDDGSISKEYTSVHNNPDYYVIKKSDVQGDVIQKLKEIKENVISLFTSGTGTTMTEFCVPLELDAVINALIAQSDMVTIPREVLAGMRKNGGTEFLDGYALAAYDILNYKKAGE